MAFKVVVSDPKNRKAYQKDADEASSGLSGKKIGEKLSGDFLGLTGYELEITGGSDKDGFPMRKDVEGIGRKRALLSGGSGFHPKIKGQRKRKSVRGNTISVQISQINMKIVKHGEKSPEELLGVKPKEKKAEETPEDKQKKKQQEVAKLQAELESGKKPEEGKKPNEEKAEPEKTEASKQQESQKKEEPKPA